MDLANVDAVQPRFLLWPVARHTVPQAFFMSILPDPETFRKLADGTFSGPWAKAARLLLASLALPYGAATTIRNRLYDRGVFRAMKAPIPVVSVGNLTVGGTGKTPLVAWICRQLIQMGRHPAIVSRGYGARPGETSDEAAELAILLPGVPHLANRDRVAGVTEAATRGADVAVLDDGFQHRRLWRDLDIVAIDASDPFGCNHLLPRGLLRESVRGLARADAFVLTRATSIDDAARDAIRAATMRACDGESRQAWMETEHRPVAIRSWSGMREPLAQVGGRRIAAFCGIGNPEAFRRTLDGIGVELVGFRSFADHHAYGADELRALASWAGTNRAEMLLTTLKDLVRIRADSIQGLPLAALEIALDPIGPVNSLETLLRDTLSVP
jgi:tetraacyldisaccharide 4'-kinase